MPGPDRAQRRRAGRSGHRGCVPRRQFRTRTSAGVRRLRSAWKLFDGWIAPVPDAMLQQARAHRRLRRQPRPGRAERNRGARAGPRRHAGDPRGIDPARGRRPDHRRRQGLPGLAAGPAGMEPGRAAAAPDARSPTARPRTPRPSRPSAWKAACPARWCSPPSSRCKARSKRPGCKSSWRGGCAAGTARSPIRACSSLRWTFPRATSCASAASGCATAWPSPNRCCPPPSARLPQAAVARAGHPG